jgi:hypothetical protein
VWRRVYIIQATQVQVLGFQLQKLLECQTHSVNKLRVAETGRQHTP